MYSFTLAEPRSSLDVTLSGLKARSNVALELFQLKGRKPQVLRRIGGIDFSKLKANQRRLINTIRRSDQGGNSSESINLTGLGSGEYYLRVQYRAGRRNVGYQLSGFANPDPAGESLGTARTIASDGTLFNDFVGTSDPSDYYKFNVNRIGTTTISLNNLSADANVRLLDAAGNQITASNNGGTTPETITVQDLAKGDYYLEVNPASGAATTYQIGVNTVVEIEDPPNDGPPGAPITVDFNRRFLTQRVTEDDLNDYYSFNLDYDARFELSLTGLTADANVRLFNALDGTEVAASVNPGTTDESIIIAPIDPTSSNPVPVLARGSYYIQVSSAGAGQNTPYRLEYYALPATDLARNTPGEALNITASLDTSSITQPRTFADFVGGVDDNDYFTFAVQGSKFFSLKLDVVSQGATDNTDVQLFKSADDGSLELITSSTSAGRSSETFGGNLGAGTYYLRVFPGSPEQGAFYSMNLYTRNTTGVPSIARDINSGGDSSFAAGRGELTVVGNNKVFFVANDGTGETLWQADGSIDPTDIGTLQSIKKTTLGVALNGISNLVSGEFNGNSVLYFTAEGSNGLSLWRTDGTAEGTQSLLSVDAVNANGFQGKPIDVDGTLYFLVNPAGSLELNTLWRTDGSVAGTTQIVLPGDAQTRLINELTAIDSTLFFSADSTATGRELWRLDNSSTTAQVIEVNPATSPGSGGPIGEGSGARNFIKYNNALYFVAGTFATGDELWKYDLSSGTSTPVTAYQDSDSFFGATPNFTIFKNELYFTANSPSGLELLKLNTAGTVQLAADINTTGGDSTIGNLTVAGTGANEALYFAANDGVNGQELWKYTGTGSATQFNILPDAGLGSEPQNLIDVGGTLYFSATGNTANGLELWKINTAGVPELVQDILSGVESSNPSQFVEVLGRLFFVANNGSTTVAGNGFELWVI